MLKVRNFFSFACAMCLAGVSVETQSATISFDYSLSGFPIQAQPLFGATQPSAPIPGPIVSEYRPAGVTFYDGVILSYDAFGGPTDTRTASGSFLESPPNLLASADFLPLANGSSLPGRITANFAFPVTSVSVSIRNGKDAANFTLSAYSAGNLVASDSIGLSDFLAPGQDGLLTVVAPNIDEVRVQSSQPIGQKDFGLDGFDYVPVSSTDNLHASFRLAKVNSAASQRSQDIASKNFFSTVAAIADLDNNGKTTGGEAFVKIWDYTSNITDLITVFKGSTITPIYIISPCETLPTLLTISLNCSTGNHLQVQGSLFDKWDSQLVVDYLDGDILDDPNLELFMGSRFGSYDTIIKATLVDTIPMVGSTRAVFDITTVSDVTEAIVPIPAIGLPFSIAVLIISVFLNKKRNPQKRHSSLMVS